MRMWYPDRTYAPSMNEGANCEDRDDAEGLKAALSKFGPRGEEGWEVAWDLNPRFWSRLQLQQLKVDNLKKYHIC